jgi:hypothetical protein
LVEHFLSLLGHVKKLRARATSNDSWIYVKIGNKTLCLPKESFESEMAMDRLHQGLIGQKIGLLRTDEPMKPLVVGLIDE